VEPHETWGGNDDEGYTRGRTVLASGGMAVSEHHPLSTYLVPIRRWWPVVVSAVFLGFIVTWMTLPAPAEQQSDGAVEVDPNISYRATHVLIRNRVTPSTTNFDLVVMLARQGEVEGAVSEALGDAVSPGSVAAVTLEPDDDLGTLGVTALQPTPGQAVLLADTYAQELTAFFDRKAQSSTDEQVEAATERLTLVADRIQTLQLAIENEPEGALERRLLEAELDVLVGQYGLLQAEVQNLSTQDLAAGSTFETLQEPVPISTAAEGGAMPLEMPTASGPRFAVGAVLALILGLALVFVVDWADTRIRTREDAEDAFGLPVMAELPRRTRVEQKQAPLAALTDPSSSIAEAYRTLRLALTLAPRWQLSRKTPTNSSVTVGSAKQISDQGHPHSLVVTSGRDREGKSGVVANLAVSFAETGQRVLVVDCDFRRSTVAELLGALEGPGLRDLDQPKAGAIADLAVSTTVPGVTVVRAGTPGPAPAWFLAETFNFVAQAEEIADLVIFDTGPLLATNEASSLVPSVDAVVLVCRSGKLAVAQARRVTEQLARIGAMVAGTVFVGGEGSRHYGAYYQPIRKAVTKGAEQKPWSSGGARTP
jgi:capsular exopolysaccharide synthesis family protein